MIHKSMIQAVALGGSIALAAFLVAAPLGAQELPDARTVLDRYAEAVGGEAAWGRYESVVIRGSFAMPAMGMEGRFVGRTAAPDLKLDEMEIPGYGTMRMGYDGSVAWTIDPMSGPRVLEGAERDMMVDEAGFLSDLRRPQDIHEAEVLERTEIAGEPCYLVRVVSHSGRESRECYHVDTGLRVATTATQESSMGSVEATTVYEGWEEIEGVRVPMRLTQQSAGQRIVITVEEVEFDSVEPAVFDLPSEIRTILD